MINEHYQKMLGNKSVIRELSEYAASRAKEIGYENVFDYSLGNPSVPAPESFTETIIRLLQTMEPVQLHGYSPSLGIPEVKQKLAESLNRRFGMNYEAEHIFPTSGCAGALAHAIRVVTKPGDRILVQAPFFPEYVPYINDTGAQLEIIPGKAPDFQIHLEELEKRLRPGVAAVLINSPNNPSGVAYSEKTLSELAELLTRKSGELGYPIFLLSDEPYREIAFDGKTIPYPAAFYPNTLTCYSFSKALSVPGERIGYVAVNPACDHAKELVPMCGQVSRGIGHNCPSSLIQLAVAETADDTADLKVYETNCGLLYQCLKELGFEVAKPDGTFYIMPKALEEDATAFCRKALAYDLILVPCDTFHAPGYFRMAYCIDTEKVKRSLPVIRRFVEETYRHPGR